MNKLTEAEFIKEFAKNWNEKLAQDGKGTDGKVYCVGWLNLENMLNVFLRAFKIREK